ncbi:hypothetical protein LX32DRAFT_631152, partial [Colletotrichum zoysiae]
RPLLVLSPRRRIFSLNTTTTTAAERPRVTRQLHSLQSPPRQLPNSRGKFHEPQQVNYSVSVPSPAFGPIRESTGQKGAKQRPKRKDANLRPGTRAITKASRYHPFALTLARFDAQVESFLALLFLLWFLAFVCFLHLLLVSLASPSPLIIIIIIIITLDLGPIRVPFPPSHATRPRPLYCWKLSHGFCADASRLYDRQWTSQDTTRLLFSSFT